MSDLSQLSIGFPEMDAETARRLFFQGATFIFLDFPVGSEFGIDYNSWKTGEKFKGVKMIPPGVHFLYFSSADKHGQCAPRIGWFQNFQEQEIVVKKWDSKQEDISDERVMDEELQRFRDDLRNLDQYLAPYPYQNYKMWFSLAENISQATIDRLQPLNAKITAQSEMISKEFEVSGSAGQRVNKEHPIRLRYYDAQGLPIMRLKPGTEIRFTPISLESLHKTKSDINSMDASEILHNILKDCANPEEYLGELQFAFVSFLMGHVYAGFEQWKRIVHLLSSCRKALVDFNEFFAKFMMVLHYQLKYTPKDFFVDIVTKSNFLTITLTNFFTNIETTPGVQAALKEKSAKFKRFLVKSYKWSFDSVPEDCLPIIVD